MSSGLDGAQEYDLELQVRVEPTVDSPNVQGKRQDSEEITHQEEEVGRPSLLRNVSELDSVFHLPPKLRRLAFPRVTDQDEEVAKAIRKRFERKFHRSPANINPAEAFKLLNSSEATRLLTWEGQVAACAEDENDEFWMKVC